MTGWRRPVLAIGVLAVLIFFGIGLLGSLAFDAFRDYTDTYEDSRTPLTFSEWDARHRDQALRMRALIAPYGVLILPAGGAVELLGADDNMRTGHAPPMKLMAGNAVFWALIVYGTFAVIRRLRRRRQGT